MSIDPHSEETKDQTIKTRKADTGEGSRKIMNGEEYVLRNGKWEPVDGKADGKNTVAYGKEEDNPGLTSQADVAEVCEEMGGNDLDKDGLYFEPDSSEISSGSVSSSGFNSGSGKRKKGHKKAHAAKPTGAKRTKPGAAKHGVTPAAALHGTGAPALLAKAQDIVPSAAQPASHHPQPTPERKPPAPTAHA